MALLLSCHGRRGWANDADVAQMHGFLSPLHERRQVFRLSRRRFAQEQPTIKMILTKHIQNDLAQPGCTLCRRLNHVAQQCSRFDSELEHLLSTGLSAREQQAARAQEEARAEGRRAAQAAVEVTVRRYSSVVTRGPAVRDHGDEDSPFTSQAELDSAMAAMEAQAKEDEEEDEEELGKEEAEEDEGEMTMANESCLMRKLQKVFAALEKVPFRSSPVLRKRCLITRNEKLESPPPMTRTAHCHGGLTTVQPLAPHCPLLTVLVAARAQVKNDEMASSATVQRSRTTRRRSQCAKNYTPQPLPLGMVSVTKGLCAPRSRAAVQSASGSTDTHTRACARTHTRARTRAHAHTHTRAHAHTHTRTHAHTLTRSHAHKRTRTSTSTQHIHERTHAHTHQACSLMPPSHQCVAVS
jgi:hypothetical protein